MLNQLLKASLSAMTPPIAIIGAGPCGLTLARLLECQKIDYVVYERDETAASANAGGSLDIHQDTGQAALRKAGLWDEFRNQARWEDDRFTVYDKYGKQHLEHKGGDGDEAGRPEIDRKALRQILLDSIPKEKIQWAKPLKAVRLDHANSPILEFANGTTASGFQLVVGTEGAWSKVRSMITQAKPAYSGRTYIESQIPLENPLYRAIADRIGYGTAAFLAGPTQMMVQRQGNGWYRVYFGIRVPELYVGNTIDLTDVEATRNALLSGFYADWDEELKELLRCAGNFRSWPLFQLPADSQNWTTVPGLTLAGDAAHLALPNGEGVNCAMKDALELASKIEAIGLQDLDDAVREYEKELLVRGRSHIEDGIQLEQLLASDEGPTAVVKAFEQMTKASHTGEM
ncbi:hypothetical protein AK830_g8399 [Neonectria ditissima]|uniref:FAD-binding domain-containing protein n=1 Tax=Neonectria ditissima TaxID=78410 RepID=A0A0P7AKJ7_9HYPO|nr:hypothetical protein AK830_g8399 [Neonectria ditissima]